MICCVVLASGFSRRFGSNKLLAPVAGKPMYLHILEQLSTLRAAVIAGHSVEIVVVTQYDQIERSAQQKNLCTVYNDQASEGISASIRHGVRAKENADWFAFFVADQPHLRAETVRLFLQSAIQSGKTLACVTSNGERGNPTLFHSRYRSALLALSGDVGGRRIFKRFPEELFTFEVAPYERLDYDVGGLERTFQPP